MGGRDPVLHYSSDAGVAGCLIGAPDAFPYVVSNACMKNAKVRQYTSLL